MPELELDIIALQYSTPEASEKQSNAYLQTDLGVFSVLQDFLQPKSRLSTKEAVTKIIALLQDDPSYLQAISNVSLELAEQIPSHHPSQLKLVRLLWLIGRNPLRVENNTSPRDRSAAFDMFYQHLREEIVDNNSGPDEDDRTVDRYINYQAFLANLMAAGLWLPDPNAAVMAMHGAFMPGGELRSLALQEAWVIGAAQWILWNGQGLFKLLLWPSDTHNEAQFTRESWQEWKSGFQAIAKNESHGQNCRLIAERTAQLMDVIEPPLAGH